MLPGQTSDFDNKQKWSSTLRHYKQRQGKPRESLRAVLPAPSLRHANSDDYKQVNRDTGNTECLGQRERARQEREGARQKQETARQEQERARREQETARQEQETARQEQETARQEQERAKPEQERAKPEQERTRKEQGRAGDDQGSFIGVEVCLEPMLKWMSLSGFPVLRRSSSHPDASSDAGPPPELASKQRQHQVTDNHLDLCCKPRKTSTRCIVLDDPDLEKFPEKSTASTVSSSAGMVYTSGRPCSKAAWLRQSVTSWVMMIMLIVNAVRSFFLFRKTKEATLSIASALVYATSWHQAAVICLLTYYTVGHYLPTLLLNFRSHQERFGPLHVPSARLKVIITRLLLAASLINGLGTLTGAVSLNMFSTIWQGLMVPFESTTGSWHFVSVIFVCVLLTAYGQAIVLCIMFFSVLSYVLRGELRHIGREMRALLTSGTTSGTTCRASKTGNMGWEGSRDRERNPADDGERSSRRSLSTKQGSSRRHSLSKLCQGQEPQGTASEEQGIMSEVEATFDELRARHESACTLLESCHNCVSHVAPMCYAFVVPTLCLLIYALVSGVVTGDELPPLVFVSVLNVCNFVAVTAYGSRLHEEARSPLSAIFAADWSALPNSMLHKFQLLVTRISVGDPGFSVYGLFTINRETVLMIGGTFVTYAVVVIQFQLGTDKTCSKCDVNTTLTC